MTWVSKDDDPLENLGAKLNVKLVESKRSFNPSLRKTPRPEVVKQPKALPSPISPQNLGKTKKRRNGKKMKGRSRTYKMMGESRNSNYQDTVAVSLPLRSWGGWLLGVSAVACLVTFYLLGVI